MSSSNGHSGTLAPEILNGLVDGSGRAGRHVNHADWDRYEGYIA